MAVIPPVVAVAVAMPRTGSAAFKHIHFGVLRRQKKKVAKAVNHRFFSALAILYSNR